MISNFESVQGFLDTFFDPAFYGLRADVFFQELLKFHGLIILPEFRTARRRLAGGYECGLHTVAKLARQDVIIGLYRIKDLFPF